MGLKAGFMGFFIFVWLIGAFLGSTFEQHDSTSTWAGSGTGGYEEAPKETIGTLLGVKNIGQRTETIGEIPMPLPTPGFFSKMGSVILWQFSFLYDDAGNLEYGLIYYCFFLPFAVMGILSVILIAFGLIRGNLSFT